jgi:primary-amine oxidase
LKVDFCLTGGRETSSINIGGIVQAHRLRTFALWLLSSMTPALAVGQTTPTEHPLEALNSQEYWIVHDTLQATGKLDDDTYCVSILLHEPPKDSVLKWKLGDAISRKADVILMRKGRAIEVRIDITDRTVESWKERPDVQAPTFEAEFSGLGDEAKKDTRLREALARHGVKDFTTVECSPLPFGYFALPELEGHRIFYGNCFDVHGAFLTWGRPIEGLYFEMDAAEGKVLKIIDEGTTPVSVNPNDFEEAPAMPAPGTTPISIAQPQGPSFRLSHGEVSWQNWHFRVRLDPRVGPILNLVRLDDGPRQRSVMYEGSLSELFVPYMDPAEGWATRVFIDAGEFYPGGLLRKLEEGIDCPPNAEFIDALGSNEHGLPRLRPRQACLFELYAGNPAWRHFENETVWGRPTRELVLRSAAVIGNYDYILDWRFQQDGSIRVAVGATGVIDTKAAKQKSASDHAMAGLPGAADEFGRFVGDNTIGVNHDHFFSFRLDLDVDGQNNTFMADRLKARQLPASGHRKSIWVAEPFVARTERDAMMDIQLDTPLIWMFVNPNVRGPRGYPTGYEIMPGANASSLLDRDDGPQRVGAFSNHQLWVTPYQPGELYASGVYPVASKGADGLAAWTRANRPIENTDIVAWYTLGFHHVPRSEDWPVMPVIWHDFLIMPFNFFPQNPALTLPNKP